MSRYAGFGSVKLQKPPRSSFDLTHDKRMTTRMGRLTPIVCLECVPSDSFRGSSEILLRLAPLLAPIFDQIELYVHYFFVPNRLLWQDWEEFITGGRLGVGIDPVSAPVPPFIDIGEVLALYPTSFNKSSLSDYLGVPLLSDTGGAVSYEGKTLDVMPHAAYQLVWMEYYRDRNLVADNVGGFDNIPLPSGVVAPADFNNLNFLETRNYMHDYFTSSLPFTQRGEEVLMPVQLGGSAPLYLHPISGGTTDADISGQENASNVLWEVPIDRSFETTGDLYVKGEDFDGTSTSINDFRSAYALQVWLERNAIGGSRYTESTQAHFGVKPQDSRLQRPEYIGGGRIPVRISEVVSTAWSTDATEGNVPLANMAGHGVTYGNTNQFNYFCTEHGFIIGIASIMNPPSYQQGLPRMFRRRSFLDYPWPTFAKLGEQEVSAFEIYADPDTLTEDADGNVPLFGYQSRYADWKYICSSNHGDFKDDLLFWTLTRVFASEPVLSQTFNQFDDSTQNRIFAVQDTDNFWMYIHNKINVKRPLPYFGTPNTLGFGSN